MLTKDNVVKTIMQFALKKITHRANGIARYAAGETDIDSFNA
jgi:hypothetical protein